MTWHSTVAAPLYRNGKFAELPVSNEAIAPAHGAIPALPRAFDEEQRGGADLQSHPQRIQHQHPRMLCKVHRSGVSRESSQPACIRARSVGHAHAEQVQAAEVLNVILQGSLKIISVFKCSNAVGF